MILQGGAVKGARVLRRETVDLMARDHIAPLVVPALKTAAPALSVDVEPYPGVRKGWGSSFLISSTPAPTGRAAGSLAWSGLANTHFWIDRVRRVSGVFLSQVLPFYDHTAMDLFGKFETEV
jgi:methyl acetate hydrolase